MKLERPQYGQGKTKKALFAFGSRDVDLPDFDRPISVKENFYRSLRHQDPQWVPFPALEMQELHMAHIFPPPRAAILIWMPSATAGPSTAVPAAPA